MDKRSWPWKKKSSERSLASNDSAESSPVHSTRHADDQDVSRILTDHTRLCEDGTIQSQQVEEKIKHLNEKLSVALLNVSAKDELAKQHAKVAEEAVSGWESAEAEAMTLKQQLDSAIQQKLATEDRVSHLDGALKECMWQLRHVREEQEENIHDAIAKKTRDWDRVRSELEEKLADVEQKFLERDAESKAMSKLLQERARSISEVAEAHSQAEAELNVLQIQLESVEKENASLKYELNVVNKELEIRNEERGLSQRAADAVSKQHVEDVRKIAKLEAECQRLRGLVRKKLPGPGALAQMKLEIEGPGKEKGETNRRRSGKGAGSMRAASIESEQVMAQEEASNAGKDADVLSERLNTMEEESKMLKEALAKRNNELQSSRLMCTRTASKLSSVEQQLDALNRAQGIPKGAGMPGLAVHVEATRSLSNSCEPSLTSLSEDGNDGGLSCAESWASALIAELDQFKRGKPTHNPENTLDTSKMELMDDFIEMEQLASLSASKSCKSTPNRAARKDSASNTVENRASVEHSLAKKEAELQEAHQLCEEMGTKLASAVEQLASLQFKNAANESSLLSLREKLDMIFEAEEEGANLGKVLDEARAVMGVPRHSMARLRAHIRRLSKGSHPGDFSSTLSLESTELIGQQAVSAAVESSSEEEASSFAPDADCKLHAIGPELTSAICKVVRLVEDLAVATTVHQLSDFSHREFQYDFEDVSMDSFGKRTRIVPGVQCQNPELDAKIQKFIAVSNHFLHGKVVLVQFLAELSSVLSHLSKVALSGNNGSPPKHMSWDKSFHAGGELEELSGANSPISDTSKSDGSEKIVTKVVPTEESNSVSKNGCSPQEISRIEEELRKVRCEKLALETHMRAEFRKFGGMEQELAQLKTDKVDLENNLGLAKEKLEYLKIQLSEAEQLVANLRVQLASTESSMQLADEQLSSMAASRAELESQLKANGFELSQLRENVEALEIEILDEHRKNADLEAQCQEFRKQLQEHSDTSCSRCAAADEEAERASKEREIAAAAEKLAECQRTILVLGEQLKAIASSKNSTDDPVDQSIDQPLDEVSSVRQLSSHSGSTLLADDASEAGSSARFVERRNGSESGRYRRSKQDLLWNPRDSISSDLLDAELASLSKRGPASGRTLFDVFGGKIPVHEDYIEAVAQIPSSPEEVEPVSPKKSLTKHPHRKKKTPRSFVGVDLSKSMNDAGSPATTEKHSSSSFSRFFSRTKSSS